MHLIYHDNDSNWILRFAAFSQDEAEVTMERKKIQIKKWLIKMA